MRCLSGAQCSILGLNSVLDMSPTHCHSLLLDCGETGFESWSAWVQFLFFPLYLLFTRTFVQFLEARWICVLPHFPCIWENKSYACSYPCLQSAVGKQTLHSQLPAVSTGSTSASWTWIKWVGSFVSSICSNSVAWFYHIFSFYLVKTNEKTKITHNSN